MRTLPAPGRPSPVVPGPLVSGLLLAGLLLSGLLVSGCSSSSPRATPTPNPTPSASPVPTASDAYASLAPPTSPGVGSYDALVANRAYQAAHGFLALQLLEPATLRGSNKADLVQQLQGAVQDTTVARNLGGAPTRRGLDYRPLFAPDVRPQTPLATVVRSSYTADEVRGLGGEQGLRISWSGTVHYHLVVAGTPRVVAFALSVGYVFGRVATEPSGLQLQQVVHGSSHAAPVLASCLVKGLLVPVAGSPSATDDGPGPYPRPAGGPPCPL